MNGLAPSPLVSVVVLNFNGMVWLERCLESLLAQTIGRDLQIIVVDNASTDGSQRIAHDFAVRWPQQVRLIESPANLGYCAGNNLGARSAQGQYLLFLNNDTWLEADCIERLLDGVVTAGADAAGPTVLNYDSNEFQTVGATGIDLFGQATGPSGPLPGGPILMPPGCAFLVKRNVFEQLGGFDPEFFMYADEMDLGWRLALAGCRAMTVPDARVHHRGAANANPKGGTRVAEFRTNATVRFYAARNGLLVLLKNAQHLLLLLVISNLALIFLEAVLVSLLVRRWRTIRDVYLKALSDCWRLRRHICKERQRIRGFRKLGDVQMLRFLRLKPALWTMLQRVRESGFPIIEPAGNRNPTPSETSCPNLGLSPGPNRSKPGQPPHVG